MPRKERHKNAMSHHALVFPKAHQRKMVEAVAKVAEAEEVVGAMADEITIIIMAEEEVEEEVVVVVVEEAEEGGEHPPTMQ